MSRLHTAGMYCQRFSDNLHCKCNLSVQTLPGAKQCFKDRPHTLSLTLRQIAGRISLLDTIDIRLDLVEP